MNTRVEVANVNSLSFLSVKFIMLLLLTSCAENMPESINIIDRADSVQQSNARNLAKTEFNLNALAFSHEILTPSGPLTIQVGDRINLIAELGAGLTNSVEPLTFLWLLDGAAADVTGLAPEPVLFQQLGVFNVEFLVVNALGEIVGNTVHREITVSNGLIATISPPKKTEILLDIHEAIDFSGSYRLLDPQPNQSISYLWYFDGAALDSIQQNPGLVPFNTAGDFQVSLIITLRDANDIVMDVNETNVNIVVIDPNASNGAALKADGILAPLSNLMIEIGTPITLEGAGIDVGNTGIATYLWKFKASKTLEPILLPDILLQSPGEFIFDQVGKYKISYRARGVDALGLNINIKGKRDIIVFDPLAPPKKGPKKVDGITSPLANMTLELGSSLFFDGLGFDNGTVNNATYLWKFSVKKTLDPVIIPDILEQTPGEIIFDQIGEYKITYRAKGIDATGKNINIKGKRNILVFDPSNPNVGRQKTDGILAPLYNMVVGIGTSVIFEGQDIDPSTSDSGSYLWKFKVKKRPPPISMPDILVRNPGNIVFDQAGKYDIRYQATGIDLAGQAIKIKGKRKIIVLAPTPPPVGTPAPTPVLP